MNSKTKGRRGRPKKIEPEVEVLDAEDSAQEVSEPAEVIEVSVEPSEVEVLPPAELEDMAEPESDTKDVVPYDALRSYMQEISRHPALSREEEKVLALRYFEEKDLDAAYKLVVSNLWLVVKIARDYERAARSLLDIIQEGNIGLMEAVKNFDPYRGVRFPSYAVWWIKAYILRYVIANWRLVKLGTTQAQRKLFFNLKKEKEKLEQQGFYPGPKLLAEKLQVNESDVVEMEQRLNSPDLSVDAPIGPESDADFLSLLSSDSPSAEDLLASKQLKEMLKASLDEFASTLNDKELIIFRQRLLSDDKSTLHEIAEKFSLSKERIRQIENRLREKLRVFLANKLGVNLEQYGVDD